MTDLALHPEKDNVRSRLKQLFPGQACVEESDLLDTSTQGQYVAFRIGPDTLKTIHRYDKSEAVWKPTGVGKWWAKED